jgi:hypothetical protein
MQIERGNVACSNGAKRSNVARLAEARDADPQDRGAQDWANAPARYSLIEELLPKSDRGSDGVLTRSIHVVKQSIRRVQSVSARDDGEGVRQDEVPAAGGARRSRAESRLFRLMR